MWIQRPIEHMQQDQRGIQLPAGPGGIVAYRRGRAGAINAGDDIGHVSVLSSLAHQLVDGVRLVVHAEAVDDGGAGLVEPEHFHFGALAAELDDYLVQRGYRGNVPEMRAAQVDYHLVQYFPEVECADELVRGAEEHLPGHLVGSLLA